MAPPYRKHLRSSKDLETTYEAVRAGFVALALEKNIRATPFVAEARALKIAASEAKSPKDLLKIDTIQNALLTAAGLSDKALNHLDESNRKAAIQGLIKNFLEPAGSNFVEELLFRFLLTRGDTLGGSMRNVAGMWAQKKLTRAIIARLRLAKRPCRWQQVNTTVWVELPEDDAEIELHVRGLSWESSRGPRTLVSNMTVPFLRNNVDLCLFNVTSEHLIRDIIETPAAYLGLGELKGGIDPAGADEHWKTARTALDRIREGFKKHKLRPHTFFIGAAIEPKMAAEIWRLLERGHFENAANLTNDDQLASVADWLCGL
jgi:hypothetical protein